MDTSKKYNKVWDGESWIDSHLAKRESDHTEKLLDASTFASEEEIPELTLESLEKTVNKLAMNSITSDILITPITREKLMKELVSKGCTPMRTEQPVTLFGVRIKIIYPKDHHLLSEETKEALLRDGYAFVKRGIYYGR